MISRWALAIGLLLVAPMAWAETESELSLGTIYERNQTSVLRTLSEHGQPFRGYGAVFATGGSPILDLEGDKEDALSTARLEAEASLIDAYFDDVDWPDRIPFELRRQLWNFYRSQKITFSIKKLEVVETIEDKDTIVVVVAIRSSDIDFRPPSYEGLVRAIEP